MDFCSSFQLFAFLSNCSDIKSNVTTVILNYILLLCFILFFTFHLFTQKTSTVKAMRERKEFLKIHIFFCCMFCFFFRCKSHIKTTCYMFVDSSAATHRNSPFSLLLPPPPKFYFFFFFFLFPLLSTLKLRKLTQLVHAT